MLLSTSALSSALPEVCAVLFAYLCVQFGRISKPKSRAAAATLSQKVEKKSKRSSSTADESAAGAEVEKPQSRKRVALKWLSFGLYHAAIAYLVLCAVPSLQRWLFPVFHDRVGSQTAPMATAATIFAVNAIAFHSLWLSGWHHRVNYELAISKYLPPGGVWKVFSLLLVYLFAPECCSIGLGSDNIIVEDLMSGEKLYATLHSFIATDSVTIAITVVLTLGTTAVLLLWHRWAKLDYSDLAIKNTRILNLCSVAFINGYVEEVVFRGLFLQKMFFHFYKCSAGSSSTAVLSLDRTTANMYTIVREEEGEINFGEIFFHRPFTAWGVASVLQALVFGCLHYHGIPSGFVGVFLTFIYGWIMGALAMYGGSMLLPVLLHTAADFVIFYAIV
ncbi:unnamed protein product [Amoebophrya sp. A120]|nr:unnamed protein product [Amoebophrya sp. A120]|eukprot:GSA120T00019147001.1